ncbi:hypothetical protein ABL78_1583 [Leptomonas seymouri]|uniref:Uncharacterized protein n=1 Tax=Leptomonas seymouri TaxID=5684 RepID=A0A0N1I748_LEPSE|nr:hypothetical protein ABL78_1583 [Leptomonas seymouri]|eukprot:KPI89250.1 hypothetical protein ABL78_1583 [Leptomonas seymouri]
MMSTAGRVVCSSSSHSPISVSSSSQSCSPIASLLASPSPVPRTTNALRGGRQATQSSGAARVLSVDRGANGCCASGNALAELSDVDLVHDGPCALVYVTPSTARQFVSLPSAAAFLQQQLQQRNSRLPSSLAREDSCEAEKRLTGGYWRLGYLVSSFIFASDHHAPAEHTCWCFTLEPLPVEQLEVCRTVLQPNPCISPSQPPSTSALADRSASETPEHHLHRHHHCHLDRPDRADASLPDLLITPLYVSTNRRAVVELCGASEALKRTLAGLPRCADGWLVRTADDALRSLLRDAPSSAALAYVLRQRHCLKLPLLQLIAQDDSYAGAEGGAWPLSDAGAEVYITLGCSTPPHAAKGAATGGPVNAPLLRADEGGGGNGGTTPWSSLTRRIAVRCGKLQHQTIVFQGCTTTAMCLRHGVAAEFLQQYASSATSSVMLAKVQAALLLLDALTPSTDDGKHNACRRSPVMTNALDVYVQCEGLRTKCTSADEVQPAALKIVGGRVRRLVAVAGDWPRNQSSSTPSTSPSTAPSVLHEPQVTTLQWFSWRWSWSENGDINAAPRSLSHPIHAQRVDAVHARVPQADLTACMQALDMPLSMLKHLHDLTHAILLLSSLTFTVRHGETATLTATAAAKEAAMLALGSVPACEAASSFLRCSPLTLVQLLTTVEVRSGSDTVRHALNCAGACQLQSALIAQLGGVLVRTVLQAINQALRTDVGLVGDAKEGEGSQRTPSSISSVISLVVNSWGTTPNNSGACAIGEAGDASNAVGGLQDWYAAYARSRVQAAVCERLIGNLRQEARCEGVEREVDTWIDQLNSSVCDTSPCSSSTVAEVVELARRARLPDQSFGQLASAIESPSMARLAEAIDYVVAQCAGSEADACPPSPAAVQKLLRSALNDLVVDEEADRDVCGARDQQGQTANGFEYSSVDVKLVWASPRQPSEDRRSSTSSAALCTESCLCLSSSSGLHPTLHFSLERLAAEVLSSVRLSKIGATTAVQRVVAPVAMRSASLLGTDNEALDSSSGVEYAGEDDFGPLYGREPMGATSALSVTQALCRALTLHERSNDHIDVSVLSDRMRNSSLALVEVIPVSREQMHSAAVIPRYPFLEPVVPLLSSAHTQETVDDAVLTYVWESQPLALALLYWSQMCHSQRCPVVSFGREWAVPLLTAYATSRGAQHTPVKPSSASRATRALHSAQAEAERPPLRPRSPERFLFVDPRTGERPHLLGRVHELQAQARYRELSLLALTTIPFCWSAVLGVSCVFLSAVTVGEMVRWRAGLREAAVCCVQSVGRGWLRRRALAGAAQRPMSTSASAAAATAAGSLHRMLTLADLQEREALEQQRDGFLKDASQHRTGTLRAAADHLSKAASALKRSWTTTLELLESELVGATTEINSFETQRRAAEDASRQEARTRARVTEEAWAEVWAEERRRTQHQQAVHQAEQCAGMRQRGLALPKAADDASRKREEERLARITTRHLTQCRRSATQSAEAALLARAVAGSQRSDAALLAQHIHRHEQRLKREAELREQRQEQQLWQSRNRLVNNASSARYLSDAEQNAATPVRSSARRCDASFLQYSDARGLVFSRPRPVAREAVRLSSQQQPERTRMFSAKNTKEDGTVGCVVVDSTDCAAINRSMRSTTEEEDWEVQRDLMSLWESSRVTT